MLLQNAMFIAGIATLIQLYPIWRIGSRLPIVMGVSFTFVSILSTIAASYGYPTMLGAVLIGGIMEGTLGLFAKHLTKFIKPIVSASVVTGIGLSLFKVGARSFGGGYSDDFGSAENLIVGTVTLVVCLLWTVFAKGYLKQLSVLAGPGIVMRASAAPIVDYYQRLTACLLSPKKKSRKALLKLISSTG